MLYSSKRVRGLSIVRATWEAFLQQCNTCICLVRANNLYVNALRPLHSEFKTACEQLALPLPQEYNKSTVKKLRDTLRTREFETWKSLKSRGKGVELFEEVKAANKWMLNKEGLSSSEWITCLKMNTNVAAVKAIPGRSLGSTRCRHGCSETETLAHVLGSCDRGMLLRNARHHTVRSKIANAFKAFGWLVYEEVSCLAVDGSTRRVDIIAMQKNSKHGLIIDPTIRFEQNHDQSLSVDAEKKKIYDPTIPYFLDKYQLNHVEVVGLFIGARGTITKFFETFRKKYGLPTSLRDDIVMTVLKKSCQILQNHMVPSP